MKRRDFLRIVSTVAVVLAVATTSKAEAPVYQTISRFQVLWHVDRHDPHPGRATIKAPPVVKWLGAEVDGDERFSYVTALVDRNLPEKITELRVCFEDRLIEESLGVYIGSIEVAGKTIRLFALPPQEPPA